jgi:hypothetical protein
MRFVRVTVSHTQNLIVGAVEQDTPFEREDGGRVQIWREIDDVMVPEECEVMDLGVVEEQAWTNREGKPCRVTEHILERLESGDAGIEKLHDCPCTHEGIKARLRARGPDGIPVKVRAWLANVLPPDLVDAIGIGRGLPISAMRAAEALRNRRDPKGGSRMEVLDRIAQKQANSHSAARLRARQRVALRAQAADEAFNEKRASIASVPEAGGS